MLLDNLRSVYCHIIDCIHKESSTNIFCNGSVTGDGRVFCGVLVFDHNGCEELSENTLAIRLS